MIGKNIIRDTTTPTWSDAFTCFRGVVELKLDYCVSACIPRQQDLETYNFKGEECLFDADLKYMTMSARRITLGRSGT